MSVALDWAASSSSSTDRIDHMVLRLWPDARIGVRAAGKQSNEQKKEEAFHIKL